MSSAEEDSKVDSPSKSDESDVSDREGEGKNDSGSDSDEARAEAQKPVSQGWVAKDDVPNRVKKGGWNMDGAEESKTQSGKQRGRRSRRRGDVANDSAATNKKVDKKKRRGRRSSKFRESGRRRQNDSDSDSGDDQVMAIPTLEEDDDEDGRADDLPLAAQAPKMMTLRVKSIDELNQDIKYFIPTATEGGIDMSLLTRTLAPQSSLAEVDEHWTFNGLLQDVAQDINREIEANARAAQKQREEDDKNEGPGALFSTE